NGSLADGTRFSQVSGVSWRGYWPLYASLNAGRAVLLGWIEFSAPTEQQFWGVLHLAAADARAEDTMVIPVVGVKATSP
ncbi:MAG TPA: hypothetical protein VNO52_02690, partial [Methylomirabilota bacterium]|nr:hypothetical protein [Methylomirabilota bacterium]